MATQIKIFTEAETKKKEEEEKKELKKTGYPSSICLRWEVLDLQLDLFFFLVKTTSPPKSGLDSRDLLIFLHSLPDEGFFGWIE